LIISEEQIHTMFDILDSAIRKVDSAQR
jgi:hypothetical protein